MSNQADPVLLRQQLLAHPSDSQLRRAYLDCRTPELLDLDKKRATTSVVVIVAVLGMLCSSVLGLMLGGFGSGTTVISVGSVHMQSSPKGTQVRNYGAAMVTQGGGLNNALSCAVGLAPFGAILGGLAGLFLGARFSTSLAEDGPRPWWGYCLPIRSRAFLPRRDAISSLTNAELFLVHPQSKDFLERSTTTLPGRTPWYKPMLYLASAGLMLILVDVCRQDDPPIPQHFLEAPWAPAPVPVLVAFTLISLYLLIRAPLAFLSWRRGVRLEQEGEVLPGVVVACHAQQVTVGGGENTPATRYWQITLDYEFSTPAQTIVDQIGFTRGDWPQDKAPAPGTPVAVVYCDDRVYQIL